MAEPDPKQPSPRWRHSTLRSCSFVQPSWKREVTEPERNLPAWFTDGYKRYCSMAQVDDCSCVIICSLQLSTISLFKAIAANSENEITRQNKEWIADNVWNKLNRYQLRDPKSGANSHLRRYETAVSVRQPL